MFLQCRPSGIYKADYLKELVSRYGDPAETIAPPELPDWCIEEEEGSDNEEQNGEMTEDGSRPDGSRKRIRRDPRLKVKKGSKGCSLICQDFYNASSHLTILCLQFPQKLQHHAVMLCFFVYCSHVAATSRPTCTHGVICRHDLLLQLVTQCVPTLKVKCDLLHQENKRDLLFQKKLFNQKSCFIFSSMLVIDVLYDMKVRHILMHEILQIDITLCIQNLFSMQEVTLN